MNKKLIPVGAVAFLVLTLTGCDTNYFYIADPVDQHDHLRLNEDLLTDEERRDVRCFRISLDAGNDGIAPEELGVACLEEQ